MFFFQNTVSDSLINLIATGASVSLQHVNYRLAALTANKGMAEWFYSILTFSDHTSVFCLVVIMFSEGPHFVVNSVSEKRNIKTLWREESLSFGVWVEMDLLLCFSRTSCITPLNILPETRSSRSFCLVTSCLVPWVPHLQDVGHGNLLWLG